MRRGPEILQAATAPIVGSPSAAEQSRDDPSARTASAACSAASTSSISASGVPARAEIDQFRRLVERDAGEPARRKHAIGLRPAGRGRRACRRLRSRSGGASRAHRGRLRQLPLRSEGDQDFAHRISRYAALPAASGNTLPRLSSQPAIEDGAHAHLLGEILGG